jgi:hypothetical protein
VESEQPKRPRRRATDRVEDVTAWLLTALALLVVLAGIVTAIGTSTSALERAAVEAADRTPVRATLLEAADVVRYPDSGAIPRRVPARWTGRGGEEVTGDVHVALALPAGARIVIWLDRQGRVVEAPVSQGAAVIMGVMEGLGVIAIGWGVLVGIWLTVRRVTLACNCAAWDKEWETVEPKWSGRKRI